MVVINTKNGLYSLTAHGKIGKPNGFGAFMFGWSPFGEVNDKAGYYQKRYNKKRTITVRTRHYWPTNTETPARRAWRNVFAQGMQAWRELDNETRQEYNKRRYPFAMHGVNRFLREYLKNHSA
jgi:hypothetical protein